MTTPTLSLGLTAPTMKAGLDLEMQHLPGTTPPGGLASLGSFVSVDLAVGALHFFSCIEGSTPSYGVITDFAHQTATQSPHVFRRRQAGGESSVRAAYANLFATYVGIAFLAEHAGATWFASLGGLWNKPLPGAWRGMRMSRMRAGQHGPDYLVSPFDPRKAPAANAVWAVELKARKNRVGLHDGTFANWRAQAGNVRLNPPTARLKSWVVAFNYAVDGDRRSRAKSALLVEDPWVGNVAAEPLPPEAAELVIREHLARQCRNLEANECAPFVLLGREPETDLLPPVYSVRGLPGGAYLGRFGTEGGPAGTMQWLPRAPLGVLSAIRRYGPIRLLLGDPGGNRLLFWPDDITSVRVGSLPHDVLPLADWLSVALGGTPQRGLFLGQDAAMVRRCFRTPVGRGLEGAEFTEPRSVNGDRSPFEGALQLTRSGFVVADASLVTRTEPGFWSA